MSKEFLVNFSSSNDPEDVSRLSVEVPNNLGISLPISIRDAGWHLVGHSSSNKPITLNPGSYIVQLHCPDGSEQQEYVELSKGESRTISMSQEQPEVSTGESKTISMSPSKTEKALQTTPSARNQPIPSVFDLDKAHHCVIGVPQSVDFNVLQKSLANINVACTEQRSFSIPESQAGIVEQSGTVDLRYGYINIDVYEFTADETEAPETEVGNDESWGCMVRLLEFDGSNLEWVVSQSGLANAVGDSQTINGVSVTELVFKAKPRLQVLEVCKFLGDATRLGNTTCIVLPLSEGSRPKQITIRLWDNGNNFLVDCNFIESPRASTVLKYLAHGAVDFAISIAGEAEQMLFEKVANPIEAVIGGYALLRVGNLSRLHEWPTNLCKRFPALADGAIIAGELEALKGNHKQAIGLFTEASKRGLPMFSEGLSILVTRLRAYLLFQKNIQLTVEQRKLLEKAYNFFSTIALYLNENSELLSFSSVALVSEDKKHIGWNFIAPNQLKQQGVSLSQFPAFFEEE